MNTPSYCTCAVCSTPSIEAFEALAYSDDPADSARYALEGNHIDDLSLAELEEYAIQYPVVGDEYGLWSVIASRRAAGEQGIGVDELRYCAMGGERWNG